MTAGKPPSLVLINPWIYDFAAYDFWAKPMGFLYLASILRENGFDLHYLDCLNAEHPAIKANSGINPPPRQESGKGKFLKTKVEKPAPLKHVPRNYGRYGIPVESFVAELGKISQPQAILVTSGMTYWYPGVFEVISIAKRIFPHTPVILGGIYASLCHSHAEQHSGADFVIAGPGEIEGVRLISSLTGREVTFLPDPESLDSFPYPAFDLINPIHYVCILTSRGCPYRCQYCASRTLRPGYSSRDPQAVADEIERWNVQRGIQNFAFYDDALLHRAERHFIPLMNEIIRRRIPCSFHASNGINIRGLDEEIAHLMFRGGFRTIRLGLETADDDRMIQSGGKTTREEFVEAVRCLRAAGFTADQIGVFLLVGLPEQKAEEVEDSIRFVRDCGVRPFLAEYSPIPGTALWEKAVSTSPFEIANEPLLHNNSILPCQGDDLTVQDVARLKLMAKRD